MLWFFVGCVAPTPTVPLHEIYDVPPPPGTLTLRLGPSEVLKRLGGHPGDVRFIGKTRVELVDVEGSVWTLYVPRSDAEDWLDKGSIEL